MVVWVRTVVMSVRQVEVAGRNLVLALDLRGGRRKKVDVHGVMEASWADIAANVTSQVRARVARVGRVRVGWRHVWRRQLGVWRRHGHRLWRRWHHVLNRRLLCHLLVRKLLVVEQTSLGSDCSSRGRGMLLVTTTRVRVVVYPRVSGKLVRSAEALRAAGELASMWLLAGVGADVTSLML